MTSTQAPRQSGRYELYEAALPAFTILINQKAFNVLLKPDEATVDPKRRQHAVKFQHAFGNLWKAEAFRREISQLNPNFWSFVTQQEISSEPESSWYHGPQEMAHTPARAPNSNVGLLACNLVIRKPSKMAGKSVVLNCKSFSAEYDVREERPVALPPGNVINGWQLGQVVEFEEQRYKGEIQKVACTENRLLNGLAKAYLSVEFEGSIVMYSDRLPCKSCQQVIAAFLQEQPSVEMTLIFSYEKSSKKLKELRAAGCHLVEVRTREA